MKSYIPILFLFLLTAPTTSTCSKGCLRCGEDQKCILCDSSEYYYSKNEGCEKMSKENCDVISSLGDCLSCSKNYFLDINTIKCVNVEKPLVNCLVHLSATECSECDAGFYLEGLNCLKIPEVIKECVNYLGKDQCKICRKPFGLSSDGKLCLGREEFRDCALFSNFKCHACQSGYFFNENYYADLYFKGSVLNENFFSFMNAVNNGSGDKFAPSGCQKINVKNCLTVESADKCKVCENDYFLKIDKTCEKNPFVPIDKCEIYFDHLKCLKCKNGFWLENSKTCKAIIPINSCSLYDQNVESICLKCSSGFFLQTNTCNERKATVTNCDSYFNNKDDCEKCLLGFVLTSDKKKCIKEIPNCSMYKTSDETTTELVCEKCTNKNYINFSENTCLPGEINNCEDYFNNPNFCISCSNLFYLDNNVCKAHKTLSACEKYSLINKDTCSSCISDHILFVRKNHCIPNIEISFCATHSNDKTCSSCQDGYVLKENSCLEIRIDNCLQENIHNECIKCQKGYFIENGECHLYYEYQTENCFEIKDDGFNNQNNLNCQQCKSFNFPKSYLNQFVCVLETRLINDSHKITNCKKHKLIGNTKSCDQCDTDYYVDETNGTCTNTCSGTKIEYRYVGTGAIYNVDENPRKKLCVTTVPGCEIQSMDTFGDMQCLKCATGYVPTYLGRLSLKNIDGTYGNIKESQGVTYPTFTCVLKGSKDFSNSIAYPENCLFFKEDTNNWNCQQCKFRKSGIIKVNANSEVFVECDTQISGCNEDYYGGFHFEDYASVFNISSHYAFNCHNCYDADHIPVSFAIGSAINAGTNVNGWKYESLKPFNLDLAENPSLSVTKVGHLTQCLKITSLDLTFADVDFTATFTPNCAMAYIHVGRIKNFKNGASDDEISIKCAECKPGYKKILEIDNMTSFIKGCIEILNCNNDNHEKWVNSCSKCMSGYSWKWDNTLKRIRYDECINNFGDDNCMAISDLSPEFCKYCNKGYILNLDGKCEQLKVPKTLEGKYNEIINNLNIPTGNNDKYREMYLIEYLNPDGLGSTDCITGFLPFLRLDYINTACTGSDYLAIKEFKDDLTTEFVRNCKDYYGNELNPIKCKKCLNNFIPNLTNTKCLSQTNFLNCAIVNSSNTFCHTCLPTYTLRKNSCERALITNCKTYDPNTNFQKCNVCEEGYYVSADTKSCVLGLLNNCKVYNNFGNCVQCQSNYGFANLALNRESCIFLKDDLKCKDIDITSFIKHEYKCISCSDGHSLTQDVSLYDPTVCLPINPISNCKEHDVKETLTTSTLACNKCMDTFYSFENGLQCLERDFNVDNCVRMADDSQTCLECQPLYYLSVDKKTCLEYPTGVFNCSKYKSKAVCETCLPGYYLKEKLCLKIPEENIIEFCAEYSHENGAFTCARCNTNFFRENPTTCIISEAQNCEISETKTKCKSCPEQYVFRITETITDCMFQPIENCEHVDPLSKNCETCKINYYPNNFGKCSLVQKTIQNCITYSENEICKICDKTTFLAQDQKSCISRGHNGVNLMENCEKTTYNSKSICLICKEGHLFNNGNCVSCDNGIKEGCFACDPVNSSVCLNCRRGFYQSEYRGNCLPNFVWSKSESSASNGGNSDNGSYGGVFVLNFLLAFVLLFK